MAEFRGNLYIFVDEVREEKSTSPSAIAPGDVFGLREPGEMLWYAIGWAVSKKGVICARTTTAKLRNFGSFAEAMDFVRTKRKTNLKERLHLVYEFDGRKSIVTSLEQVLRLDGVVAKEDHPVLDTLTAKVGKIVAANAMVLLRLLDQEGEAAARAHFSSATYGRLWRVLHEAGLVKIRVLPDDPDGRTILKERFHLVYKLDDRKPIVTSPEQVLRLGGVVAKEDHPVLDTLTAKVNKVVAANAMALLRILDQKGEAVARAHFSSATYERLWRVLHEAGLVKTNAPLAEARVQRS